MPAPRTPAVFAVVVTLTTLAAAAAPVSAATPESVPGEVIVRFAPGVDAPDRAAARVEADVDFERALPLRGVQLVTAELGQSVPAAVAELERSSDVLYAEPNLIRRAHAVPNDSFFPLLWGLHNTGQTVGGFPGSSGTPDADIDAPEAWDLTLGSPDVVVGVVDSGVEVTHEDLSSAIWANPGESGELESNGVDDDGNLLVDDWRGWDWVDDDNLPGDEDGHGTHVSGTIAASGNNDAGVTGVSWGSRVMPLRVLDADGEGNVADLISAYRYAAAEGAQIVNASLGGQGFSPLELDAIRAAPNTLFVVAAGNEGANVDGTAEYPCAYTAANIVCVAASDQNDALADFSNFGSTSVDLAAPGELIGSTWPGDGYVYLDGTSMATPHAAGVAALIWSLEPAASVAEVKAALLGGIDAKSAFAGKTVTGGRLNAHRSLQFASGSDLTPPAVTPQATPSTPASGPPAPAPSPAPTPTPVPAPVLALDRSAPVLSLALAERRRLRTALSRGLALRARCSERCRLSLRMVVDGRTAKRAGLSRTRRAMVVGRATVTVTGSARRVALRFGRKARIRLLHLRSFRLTVKAAAGDRVGNVRRRSLQVFVRR